MKKSKTLIVTLCKSLNYGAYLQAYALQNVLISKGLEVEFLDVYGFRQSIKRYMVLLKPRDMNPGGISFGLRKLRAFKSAEEKLHIRKLGERESVDAAFLGSDEIWSLTNSSFESSPEFFGVGVPAKKIFSYAPCASNTTVDDFSIERSKSEGIRSLDHISVRDDVTKQLVQSLAPERDVCSVLDPAFLYDFEPDEKDVAFPDPYILVYTYKMNKPRIDEIRTYARNHNLKLVSAGFYNAWCDSTVACDPFEFLGYIKNAQCVITDTFHGSIFSIKYKKNFVSYSAEKPKVSLLLDELLLNSASVHNGDLARMGEIHTDYLNMEQVLNKKIQQSFQYIDECISMI